MSELQLCKSPDCNSSFPHTLIKTGPVELIGIRALPDIMSGLEVCQIFKIRTVRKLDVFLPGCRTFNSFKNRKKIIKKFFKKSKSPKCNSSFPHTLIKAGSVELWGHLGFISIFLFVCLFVSRALCRWYAFCLIGLGRGDICRDWFCLVLLEELMRELQLCKSPDCNSSFPHTLIKTGPLELIGQWGFHLARKH